MNAHYFWYLNCNSCYTVYYIEKQKKTNFIVVGFFGSGIEPMNYRTGGEHANLYITYAVTH
jgi:hypothetical protein